MGQEVHEQRTRLNRSLSTSSFANHSLLFSGVHDGRRQSGCRQSSEWLLQPHTHAHTHTHARAHTHTHTLYSHPSAQISTKDITDYLLQKLKGYSRRYVAPPHTHYSRRYVAPPHTHYSRRYVAPPHTHYSRRYVAPPHTHYSRRYVAPPHTHYSRRYVAPPHTHYLVLRWHCLLPSPPPPVWTHLMLPCCPPSLTTHPPQQVGNTLTRSDEHCAQCFTVEAFVCDAVQCIHESPSHPPLIPHTHPSPHPLPAHSRPQWPPGQLQCHLATEAARSGQEEDAGPGKLAPHPSLLCVVVVTVPPSAPPSGLH